MTRIEELELQVSIMRDALEEVLSHRSQDGDGNHVMWVGEGTFIKCENALRVPSDMEDPERGLELPEFPPNELRRESGLL